MDHNVKIGKIEATGIFAALVIAAAGLWLVAAVLVPAALVKFCWLYLMRYKNELRYLQSKGTMCTVCAAGIVHVRTLSVATEFRGRRPTAT